MNPWETFSVSDEALPGRVTDIGGTVNPDFHVKIEVLTPQQLRVLKRRLKRMMRYGRPLTVYHPYLLRLATRKARLRDVATTAVWINRGRVLDRIMVDMSWEAVAF
jgi:hypothetical protein